MDHLSEFAGKHPNILLELKTKSDNISYFLDHEVPPNVVISWSLNSDLIVQNEEHFTASLEKRLAAARRAADLGIPIAFHFHPMIYYEGWQEEYTALAKRVLSKFSSEEVLFISMGSVTFIKPVMKAIRKRDRVTKMLQMEMVRDPNGKWTYPDDLKVEMFRAMFKGLQSWREKVFFYLCM